MSTTVEVDDTPSESTPVVVVSPPVQTSEVDTAIAITVGALVATVDTLVVTVADISARLGFVEGTANAAADIAIDASTAVAEVQEELEEAATQVVEEPEPVTVKEDEPPKSKVSWLHKPMFKREK